MPLEKVSGALGELRALHLIKRATFSSNPVDAASMESLSADEAVTLLFDQTLDDPPLPIDPLTSLTWPDNPSTDQSSEEGDLQDQFKGWFLGQMLATGINDAQKLSFSTREKLVFFMHTLFTTMQSKVNNARSLFFQNQLFRKMGWVDLENDETFNFKKLTEKVCIDNAMLQFLDGRQNVKGSPNENFARELLELYTIGRGLEGTIPPASEPGDYIYFTEQDVQAAARVLSGFELDLSFATLDEITELPRGRTRGDNSASAHDTDDKQFSSRFNSAVINGREELFLDGDPTEESVIDEISQLIELIYSSEETSRHIVRKLYRYYVYHEISEEIDSTVITSLAETFRNSGYNLLSVLRELFTSRHFYLEVDNVYEDNKPGSLIKSPLDLLTTTYTFFNITLPDPVIEPASFYEKSNGLLRELDYMGMALYEPFEVAGYSAYHQFPIYNRSWISTNYLTRRYEFIQKLLMGEFMEEMMNFDVIQFTRDRFDNSIAENARELVMAYCRDLLPVHGNLSFENTDSEITPERLNYFLRAFLFSPQIDNEPEEAWTFRWNNPVDNEVVERQLMNLLNALMQSPEYQLF